LNPCFDIKFDYIEYSFWL